LPAAPVPLPPVHDTVSRRPSQPGSMGRGQRVSLHGRDDPGKLDRWDGGL